MLSHNKRLALDRVQARAAFLKNLSLTPAWHDLKCRCEVIRHRRLDGLDAKTSGSGGIIALRDRLVGQLSTDWLEKWHLHSEWVRTWVMPVVPPCWVVAKSLRRSLRDTDRWIYWEAPPWLPDHFRLDWNNDDLGQEDMDEVLVACVRIPSQYFEDLKDANGQLLLPNGSMYAAASRSHDAFTEWHEDPPNPLIETRGMFFERMKEAWNRRALALRKTQSTKRKLQLHALWFVRVQVNGETVSDILNDASRGPNDGLDPSTVRKALRAFSSLIDLPLRKS